MRPEVVSFAFIPTWPLRMRRADALRAAETIAGALRLSGRRVRCYIVGSLRRGAEDVKDIDILCVSPDPDAFAEIAYTTVGYDVIEVRQRGRARVAFTAGPGEGEPLRRRYRVDLFLAPPEELPFALFHLTGPSSYNIRVRAHAKRRGLKLSQHGLFRGERRVPRRFETEGDIARYLGLSVRAPSDRR